MTTMYVASLSNRLQRHGGTQTKRAIPPMLQQLRDLFYRGSAAALTGPHTGRSFADAALRSSYVGVHWHRNSGKWAAAIRATSKHPQQHLGVFETQEAAAAVYDAASFALRGPGQHPNFPGTKPAEQLIRLVKSRLTARTPTSAYTGVSRDGGKWRAQIAFGAKSLRLGSFDTEIQAAQAFDEALRNSPVARARKLKSLNFLLPSDYFKEDSWQDEPLPPGKTSRFLGVYYDSTRNKFAGTAPGTRQEIGYFMTELAAAHSFDAVSAAVGGRTNFEPASRFSTGNRFGKAPGTVQM